MKNKNAKYIIEKLEEWFHELIDCTKTFTIEDKTIDNINLKNCHYHIEVLKHEIRAVLNMMEFWYGRNKNE